MNNNNPWRSIADKKYGETRDQFKTINDDQQLLFWNTTSVKEKFWNMCAYYEVYFDSAKDSLFCVGTVFSKSVGTAYLSCKNLTSEINDHNGIMTLKLTTKTGACAERVFEVKVEQEIDRQNGTWKLSKIETTLTKDPSFSPTPEAKIFFHDIERFDLESEFNPRHEVLCPNCMGEGKFVSFSIPADAASSGLSGYALYSENKINADNACKECGGTGRIYKDWYLKENPNVDNKYEEYEVGKGVIILDRMPPFKALK